MSASSGEVRRVLLVSLEPPSRKGGGGSRRQQLLIDSLIHRCEVIVMCPRSGELVAGLSDRIKDRVAGGVPRPRKTPFAERVTTESRRIRPDVVLVSHIETALAFGPYLRRFGAPVVVDVHNVWSRAASMDARRKQAKEWRKREMWLMGQADRVTVLSEEERLALPAGPQVSIVPNGVDAAEWGRGDDMSPITPSLAMFGSWTHSPNVHSLRWFLRGPWATIRRSVPGVALHLYGPGASPPLDEGVVFEGFAENLGSSLLRHDGVIVPIVSGGGSRVKFIEALASGVPVVSTSFGSQGYDVPTGTFLLADDPDAFASACIDVLRAGARDVGDRARRYVLEHCTWDASANLLYDVMYGVVSADRVVSPRRYR